MGILEYLAQSNASADCVHESDRFKFIDDLTILEIINLMTVGISSFNIKQQVPNDIPLHGQFITPQNLQSQLHLDSIADWTKDQKMMINAAKTKTMLFNFTRDYQFTTRLNLEGKSVEVIKHSKLLGTIIQDDLKWDLNTANIVKKANMRLELLRRVASFGASTEDLKKIYILYVRSVLEHSSVVWHSSLTSENSDDIERIQKSAVRIIMRNINIDYQKALDFLELDLLSERRKHLCLQFARKCLKDEKLKDLFPLRKNIHNMKIRNPEKYLVQKAKTDRLQKSPIIYMQYLLNQET